MSLGANFSKGCSWECDVRRVVEFKVGSVLLEPISTKGARVTAYPGRSGSISEVLRSTSRFRVSLEWLSECWVLYTGISNSPSTTPKIFTSDEFHNGVYGFES